MFYGGQEGIFSHFLFKMRKKIVIGPKPCLRTLRTEHRFPSSFQTTGQRRNSDMILI